MLYGFDDISQNSACRRELTCTSAVEHSLVDAVAVDEHSVEYVVDACDDVFVRHEHRHNNGKDAAVIETSHRSDELDSVTEDIGSGDIGEVDLRDTLCENVLGVDVSAENEGRDNAYLAAGVVTLDICSRVFLRVTELLRECESVRERHIVVVHFCKNEVGRTVENTCDLVDIVSGETAVERADYGDSTADARLEEEIAVMSLSLREEDIALFGDELLVGGRNALAFFEARLNERESGLNAAHALCNSGYLIVVEDIVKILGKFILIRRVGEIAEVEDILDIHFRTRVLFDTLLVLVEEINNARADYTVT